MNGCFPILQRPTSPTPEALNPSQVSTGVLASSSASATQDAPLLLAGWMSGFGIFDVPFMSPFSGSSRYSPLATLYVCRSCFFHGVVLENKHRKALTFQFGQPLRSPHAREEIQLPVTWTSLDLTSYNPAVLTPTLETHLLGYF